MAPRLDELSARLRAASRRHGLAWWRAELEGGGGGAPWPEELLDRRAFAELDEWRQRAAAGIERRRAHMLWRLLAEALVEADPRVATRARRPSAGLFAARNEVARELGWPSFLELRLAIDGVTEAEVARLAAVPPAPPDARDEPAASPALVGDPVAAAHAHAASLGLRASARVDRGGRAGSGRTYLIDPPVDVRVVVAADDSVRGWRRVWHELGHGLYATHHDPGLPWELADAPARALHEAVAEAFARELERPEVVAGFGGLSPAEARALSATLARRRARWHRRQQARCRFERGAYRDPDGDLDRLWLAVHQELAGSPAARPWTELIQLASDPGAQVAYAMAAALAETVRGWPPARLRALMAAGATRPWSELLADARR